MADQGDAGAVGAALNGSLRNADFRTDKYFGFAVPASLAGVGPHLLVR
jgi:phosphoenolpyruvate carboxykinase (ATP)